MHHITDTSRYHSFSFRFVSSFYRSLFVAVYQVNQEKMTKDSVYVYTESGYTEPLGIIRVGESAVRSGGGQPSEGRGVARRVVWGIAGHPKGRNRRGIVLSW